MFHCSKNHGKSKSSIPVWGAIRNIPPRLRTFIYHFRVQDSPKTFHFPNTEIPSSQNRCHILLNHSLTTKVSIIQPYLLLKCLPISLARMGTWNHGHREFSGLKLLKIDMRKVPWYTLKYRNGKPRILHRPEEVPTQISPGCFIFLRSQKRNKSTTRFFCLI